MRELYDAVQRMKSNPTVAKGTGNRPPDPSSTTLEIPVDVKELSEIDREFIEAFIAYRNHAFNRGRDEIKDQVSKNTGPSEAVRELMSFIYDIQDKIESVLTEEEVDELENYMMKVQK